MYGQKQHFDSQIGLCEAIYFGLFRMGLQQIVCLQDLIRKRWNDIQVCERNAKSRRRNWLLFSESTMHRDAEVMRRSWHFCRNRKRILEYSYISFSFLWPHSCQVSHANHINFMLIPFSLNLPLEYLTPRSAFSPPQQSWRSIHDNCISIFLCTRAIQHLIRIRLNRLSAHNCNSLSQIFSV